MKRIISTCLTAALLMSGVFVSTGFARDNGQEKGKIKIKQIMINEDFGQPEFVRGKLTLPSKNKPENIAKDYLNKKAGVKDFVIKKQFKNAEKQTVIKIHQTFNGIKIKGTQQSYIIGEDGVVEAVSGINIPDIGSRIKGSMKLKEEDALDIVRKDLKRELKHFSVEKMILPSKEDAVYTYTVDVSFETPYVEAWQYVINASNGGIIEKRDALLSASVTVDGEGVFGDYRTMSGYYGTIPDLNITPEHPYSLADLTKTAPERAVQRALKVLTYQFTDQSPESSNLNKGKEITSDEDGAFTGDSLKSYAVDAHYFAGKVYDFYKDRFNRYSYDNAGSDIIINVNAIFGKDQYGNYKKNNAYWNLNSKQMYFGDGDGISRYGFVAEAGILGHEFAHGVVTSEVDLRYNAEAGAIHEGLADLFGEAFEAYVYQREPDWLKIAECYTPDIPGDAQYDLKNPRNTWFKDETRTYPDHMNNKYNGTDDEGGAHYNAAILTKAFSLMSDGGTHYNVNVEGIGIDRLTQIIYKVITEYLASDTTDFNKFSQLCLAAAATSEGGEASAEYKSIKAGFEAVGIPYNTAQWKIRSTLSDYVVDSSTAAITQIDNHVYTFGGVNVVGNDFYSDVWEYNMNNNKWLKKSNMPKKRAYASATSLNGKAYVLFGYEDFYNYSGFFTTVDEYNPSTDQWRVLTNIPEKQIIHLSQNTAGTVLYSPVSTRDGLIEVRTGQLDPGASVTIKLQKSSDNVNFTDHTTFGKVDTSYSTNQFTWFESPDSTSYHYRLQATVNGGTCSFEVSAPYVRYNASVVSYENKIYILGGESWGTREPILTMDVYDTVTGQWAADQPGVVHKRINSPLLVTVLVDNLPKIYVFGGGSSEVEVYDINSGNWDHFADTGPIRMANSSLSGVVYKGKIHFSSNNGEILIYDPVTELWYENMDLGALNVAGISVNYQDSMFNIGFDSDGGVANFKVEKYHPLRITAFENDKGIVVQWSKYGNDTDILSIDGNAVYSGAEDNYRYTSFVNASKKHTMKVTQNHPVYGNISSKNLYTVYQKIGDIDGNNVIDSADVSLLKSAVLESVTLTDAQKVAADIDNDSDLNSIDYSLLQRYVDYGITYHTIGSIKFMIYGDVNNDGDVDFKDHDVMRSHVLSGSPLSFSQTVTADVNGDGIVNSTDMAYILRYMTYDDVVFPAAN